MEKSAYGELDAKTVGYVLGRAIQMAPWFGLDRNEAEDVAQEVLMLVNNELGVWRLAGKTVDDWNIIRWLAKYRTFDVLRAMNTKRQQWRRGWRSLSGAEYDRRAFLPNPDNYLCTWANPNDPEHLRLVQYVRDLVAGLPEKDLELCDMVMYGDLTEVEMAERLKTSRTQLRRMLKRLQRKFILSRISDYEKKGGPDLGNSPVARVTECWNFGSVQSERRSPAGSEQLVPVKTVS